MVRHMSNVIISIDQAKKSGFCVSRGDEILLYGTFVSNAKDYHDVTNEAKIFLKALIDEYNPILVTVEDIYGGLSRSTMKQLGILQGVLVNLLVEKHILFAIIAPSTWQSKLEYDKKGGLNSKKWSQWRVMDTLGLKVGEDTADAINMNYYARHFIKIVEA